MPDIASLGSSRELQRKVDHRMSKVEKQSTIQGKCGAKIKSKRGGCQSSGGEKSCMAPQVDSRGVTRQRVSYDQLSLTQFVQGFTRNILDEPDRDCRDHMLRYLSDLMEDATAFSWTNAKAAHVLLMCEMERGVLDW